MSCDFIQLAKSSIQKLRPYEPGKPIKEVALELGLEEKTIIKLASNENPLGTSPEVLRALDEEKSNLFRYPDGAATEVKQALSEHFSVESNQITTGNGSDELLRLIACAYAGVGDEIIFSDYAFAVYNIAALSVGATPVSVAAKNWGCDLDAMYSAITDKTRVIYIANPNNPTGTWLSPGEVQAFLQKVPENVLVVLDEAYLEYLNNADEAQVCNSLSWIQTHPNLIVTRTFSKAYGLAGLRVGFMVSHAQIADIVNRIRPAFNMHNLAQRAVIAALQDHEFLRKSRELNQQGMQQFEDGLLAMGLQTIPSKGNFITVDVKNDCQHIFQQLLRRGIIVRPLTGYNMPRHLRISIGLPEENSACLAALRAVIS